MIDTIQGTANPGAVEALLSIVQFLIVGAVLSRVWVGIMNHADDHDDKHSDTNRYLPSHWTIIGTVAATGVIFILSLKSLTTIEPFTGGDGVTKAAVLFGWLGMLSIAAEYFWPKAKHYVFAVSMGTIATFILIGFYAMLVGPGGKQDPFFMSLGITAIVAAWRFLFGPWRPQVKATVLATFIFWIALHIIFKESPGERSARILAAVVAFIPAVIWCILFLRDHAQRLSLVVLMFCAGMISTAPILFYDALVRHRIELHFFLFKVVPENFTRSSSVFVSSNLTGVSGVQSTVMVTLISFILVGLIEEVSKFWVLKRSGERFFHSIDDVLQLGIIVAIGFAFAENVMNPSYFISFVRQYLILPESPLWGAFMGNVLGRAILTNMVHILSTGVIAYFYGLALFAEPLLEEHKKQGKIHYLARTVHWVLRFPRKAVYRTEMMLIGLLTGIVLHGMFNFMVTLPDILPGNPRTLGDIFGAAHGSPLHFVALLIIPSLFYVVGGFWVLSVLFYRKDCMKERGCLVRKDTFVDPKEIFA